MKLKAQGEIGYKVGRGHAENAYWQAIYGPNQKVSATTLPLKAELL